MRDDNELSDRIAKNVVDKIEENRILKQQEKGTIIAGFVGIMIFFLFMFGIVEAITNIDKWFLKENLMTTLLIAIQIGIIIFFSLAIYKIHKHSNEA